MEVMTEELTAARKEIASPRMTEIADALADQDDESLIEPGQMVVTITRDGFIKRTTLETYPRAEPRRARAIAARRRAATTSSPAASTRTPISGCCSSPPAARPSARRSGSCRRPGRRRRAARWSTCCRNWARTRSPPCCRCRRMRRLWESLHLVFATASGNVRRNRLSDFRNVRASGLIAMKLDEGDHLIGVATCREGDDVLLATRKGRCIRFQLTDEQVRVFAGRDSSGVRGIKLLNRRRGHQPVGAAPCRGHAGGARWPT